MQLTVCFFTFTCLLATVVVNGSPACGQIDSAVRSVLGWGMLNAYNPTFWMGGRLETYLEGICPDSAVLQQTVSEVGATCDDNYLMVEVQFLLNNTERICTAQALQGARSLPNKECYADESRRSTLISRYRECYTAYTNVKSTAWQELTKTFCRVWHEFMTCVSTVATEECGADVAGFIQPLWNIEENDLCFRYSDWFPLDIPAAS